VLQFESQSIHTLGLSLVMVCPPGQEESQLPFARYLLFDNGLHDVQLFPSTLHVKQLELHLLHYAVALLAKKPDSQLLVHRFPLR